MMPTGGAAAADGAASLAGLQGWQQRQLAALRVAVLRQR